MAGYHVTLDGQGYVLDLRRYRKGVAETFARKQASGLRSYGDLVGPEEVWRLSDWRGGEGFERDDAASGSGPGGYRQGYGLDVASDGGGARLGNGTVLENVGSYAANTVGGIYGGKVYFGADLPLVRVWDGATVGNLAAEGFGLLAGETPISFAVFMNRLYVGVANSGRVASYDGLTWTAAKFTLPAAPAGVGVLVTFYRQAAQYLYAVGNQGGTNFTTRVHWWDGASLSSGQYDFEEPYCYAAAVLGNRLWFFTADVGGGRGVIYSLDDAGDGGNYRKHEVLSGNYFMSACTYGDAIYLGCGLDGAVYRWDGARLTLVRRLGGRSTPYGAQVLGMAVWDGALWVSIQDGLGTVGLLRYDGVGWSRPVVGMSGTSPRGLVAYGGELLALTQQTGSAGFHRVKKTPYRTSGYLETGLFDAGVPSVLKAWRSVTLGHSALVSGQSVEVQYRLEDAGAWTSLGTSATVGATRAAYAFPAGTQGYVLGLRLLLGGGAGAGASVVLRDVATRYALAPVVRREWELGVRLEGVAAVPLVTTDGSPESKTGSQLSAGLWAAKGSVQPVTYVDLDGASYSVWVADVREEVGEVSQRLGRQTLGLVRLVEAA
ncbi:MAG: hypothetical protein IT305_29555 [Chloroflexi bacterium]|nr:hypothetical protein [Chloroflexota bacterium]